MQGLVRIQRSTIQLLPNTPKPSADTPGQGNLFNSSLSDSSKIQDWGTLLKTSARFSYAQKTWD
jgi:hypothetical protein